MIKRLNAWDPPPDTIASAGPNPPGREFVDGNKRVAFLATAVFLRLNRWKLTTTADDGEQFIVGMLESNNCSFEVIVPWIRKHMGEIE